MRTAFYNSTEYFEYTAVGWGEVTWNLGQIIAHEFFGHLLNALFGNANTEVSAMYEENFYNWLYGCEQRYVYGTKRKRVYYAPLFE